MPYPAFIEWVRMTSGGDKEAGNVVAALGRLASPAAPDTVRACDEALSELQGGDCLDGRAKWSREAGLSTVRQIADSWQRSSGAEPRVTGAAVVATWFLAACEDCPDMANHGSSLLRHNPELMRDVAHTVGVIANGQLSAHIRPHGARQRAGEQLREYWQEVREKRPACCASRP